MFKYLRPALISLLLLVATTTFTYPFALQWMEQSAQSRANEELAERTIVSGPETQSKLRQSSEQYNQDLFVGRVSPGDDRYNQTLLMPGTDVIARLRVPSIDLDQPVRHSLSEEALLSGVGHAEGSSLPVGGKGTHSVLGGHRGLAQAVGFTNLPKVKVGDEVLIESLGQVMTYRVVSTEVLEPMEAAIHPIQSGRDLVTLLTCTPLGVNSHRFIATAERVTPDPVVEFGQKSSLPGFPWWAIMASGGLVVTVTLTALSVRSQKRSG